jgi:hypothetical protein
MQALLHLDVIALNHIRTRLLLEQAFHPSLAWAQSASSLSAPIAGETFETIVARVAASISSPGELHRRQRLFGEAYLPLRPPLPRQDLNPTWWTPLPQPDPLRS